MSENPGDYCWLCGTVRDDHDADHELVPFPPRDYDSRVIVALRATDERGEGT